MIDFMGCFYRDDCVQLKMLSFTVHKDAVQDLLKKCDVEKSESSES